MSDVKPVAVADRVDNLLEVMEGFGERQAAAFDEVVEKFAALNSQNGSIFATGLQVQRKGMYGDLQLVLGLPYIVYAPVVDKLRDDAFAFNGKKDLVFLLAGVSHGYLRVDQRMFRDDFDCCVLPSSGLSSDSNVAW